jgi:transposase
VPRPHCSGGQTVLRGITQRGDRSLRTWLIHRARAARRQCTGDARSGWARRLSAARGPNVAAVALANKHARVRWALLARGDRYRSTSKITSAVVRPGSPSTVRRAPGPQLRVAKD